MKLALGAAQFGLSYGVSNREGRTPAEEVKKILSAAMEAGVQVIDTAPAYGNSEQVLGECYPPGARFRVFTKTSKDTSAENLEAEVSESLRRLRVSALSGLLFHSASSLLGSQGAELMKNALKLKDAGAVQKIGVSVYSSDEIDHVLERYSIEVIQLPLNAFDQRLIQSGHLSNLKARGVEIHVRSAFLQGLLTMQDSELDPYFASMRPHLRHFHEEIDARGMSVIDACLGFVLRIPEVDSVVCGVNNLRQFAELCETAARVQELPLEGFERFALNEVSILNPALWKLKGAR
jgi:aryl-alcohol dehydrogenase-like predicted oxidoreductase